MHSARTVNTGRANPNSSATPPAYRSRNQHGAAAFRHRSIAAQRKAATVCRPRTGGRATAPRTSSASTIAGLDFDRYVELTCRMSGLPMTVARAGAHVVADSLAPHAMPSSRTADGGDARLAHVPPQAARCGRDAARCSRSTHRGTRQACTGCGRRRWLWATGWRSVRRGASPSPPTGSSWPCGRRVFAMRRAIPTDRPRRRRRPHPGRRPGDGLRRPRRRRQIHADPTVLINGPGRTKILITAEYDWRDYLDVIVDSISNLGGMACVNATAVLYEGDATPLAHAIAERLSRIAPSTPTPPSCQPRPSTRPARSPSTSPARRPGPAVLGADHVVADLGDGYAALRPAVHLLADPTRRTQRRTALPLRVGVPVVARGRDRTAAKLAGDQRDHHRRRADRRAGAEPTVVNVYGGPHATHHSAPHVPTRGSWPIS